MKCDNCDNQATMHKHYEKSDGTFADSHLCDDCFFSEYARCDTANICAWCGKDLTCETRCYDKQNRKYCDVDCMKRFVGYEAEWAYPQDDEEG